MFFYCHNRSSSKKKYDFMNRTKFWLLGAALLLIGICIGLFHVHNADVWWHIAWGQQMLQQQTLAPLASCFYFTPTSTGYLRELPNNFLGDVGLALLFRLGGVVALQLLVLFSLFGGALLILLPWKRRLQEKAAWLFLVLLLFVGFCLGTSQLQVVRNAIISLVLFPLTLTLYLQQRQDRGWKWLRCYPPLFLCWSWIHSSYLLGILSLLLLYSGDLVENLLRCHSPSKALASWKALLTLLLLLFVTLTYSWQPRQLLTTSLTHTTSLLTALIKKEHSPSPQGLTQKITQPVWGGGATPLSGDFIPTWKVLYHPAAWCSLSLALTAWLLLLFCYRGPHQLGMIALLALMSYFGSCYLRGTGYLTIVSIFILTAVIPEIEHWPRRIINRAVIGSRVALLLALGEIIHLTCFKQGEFFFKERGRLFGIGRAAVFDDAPYNFAKSHFPNTPCFSTIVTGSYASFLWKGEKKIFIDAFFAPHPKELWKDYEALLQTADLALLDRYHASIALVENSRLDWQSLFLTTSTWRPLAIG
jgi:hypothetical protein